MLEMTDYFIKNYNLAERFRDILLILMIIGLPIAIFITWYISRDREKEETKDKGLIRILLKRPWFSIPGTIIILLLVFTAVRSVYLHKGSAPEGRTAAYSNIDLLLRSADMEVSLAETYSAMAAMYLYKLWEFDKAEEYFPKALELNPNLALTHYHYSWALYLWGRMDEAIEAHKKVAELNPNWNWCLGRTYAKAGLIEEAEKILKEVEQAPLIPFRAIGRAALNAILGHNDEAFKMLNYEPHHAWAAYAAVMPDFSSLRENPRFEEFLERLKLPD